MKRIFFPLLFLLVLLGSCKTPKNISYFQGIENLTQEQEDAMNQVYNSKICNDDVLIINVTSPDRETAAYFNPPPYAYYMPGESEIGISAETQNLYTYLVDEDGYINFSVLGRIKIAGLTINEANRMMEELIKPSVPSVLVNITIANFKVGVIGEVVRPNTYSIKSSRVSVLDLIAMAGDLTIVGDRRDVLLLRDNNGIKERIHMDLTDPAIFASPYYYLQQNDIVYVRPNKAQKRNSMYSNENNFKISMFSAIFSAVSVISTTVLSIITISRDK